MDKEYLQLIESSPYVDEAFSPSQFKAGVSALRQRWDNMMPGEEAYRTPIYAKLVSFYTQFIQETTAILKEFLSGPSSPAERMKKDGQLSPESKEKINELEKLYMALVPSLFPPGTSSTKRGDLVKHGTLNPPNISLTQAMKHAIKEAFPDRKWTQGKGNPEEIIGKYVSDLRKAYDKFYANIKKAFPNTPGNMLKTFFQRNVPDQRIKANIEKIEQTISKVHGPIQPPENAASTGAATGASGAASVGSGTPAAAGAAKPAEQKPTPDDDFANIVSEVMDIIIEVVAEDTARSEPYFTHPLPTTMDSPLMHAKPPPKPVPPPGPSKKKTGGAFSIEEVADEDEELPDVSPDSSKQEPEFEDQPGKFILNFAGRYDKAKNFAIELTRKPKEITLSNGKVKRIRVIWVNNEHVNKIVVKYQDAGENPDQWKTIDLFKFSDGQADPRSINFSKQNSVYEYMKNANPFEGNLFKKVNPTLLQKIESKRNQFDRAIYAVTDRKRMEFKALPKNTLDLVMHDDGSVTVHQNPNYPNSPYDQEDVKSFINSDDDKEKEVWRKSLEHIGYFDKYPALRPSPSENIEDAVNILVAGGISTGDAEKLVQKAMESIGKAAEKMSGSKLADYVKTKLGKEFDPAPSLAPTTPTTKIQVQNIPSAVDAVKGLVKLNAAKPATVLKVMQSIVDFYGDKLSSEEYVKIGLDVIQGKLTIPTVGTSPTISSPTTTTTAATVSPSPELKIVAPEEPTEEPPVPEEPSGTSTTMSVPDDTTSKSDSKEPSSGGDVDKIEPNLGSVVWDEAGSVTWTKPDGNVRKFSAKKLNSTNSPRMFAALKKAGYPFEKYGVTLKESRGGFINPFQPVNFL